MLSNEKHLLNSVNCYVVPIDFVIDFSPVISKN